MTQWLLSPTLVHILSLSCISCVIEQPSVNILLVITTTTTTTFTIIFMEIDAIGTQEGMGKNIL